MGRGTMGKGGPDYAQNDGTVDWLVLGQQWWDWALADQQTVSKSRTQRFAFIYSICTGVSLGICTGVSLEGA